MMRVVIKNKHKKDKRYYDIWLYAQDLDTILGSILDTFDSTLISQD